MFSVDGYFGVFVNQNRIFGEKLLYYLPQIQMCMPFGPEILLLGIYPSQYLCISTQIWVQVCLL